MAPGSVAATLVALLATVAWCAPAAADPELPPTGVHWDYQLGGSAPLGDGVGIVVRDRRAAPAPGVYNVCYVNGFQSQPDERAFWQRHWALVLKRDGRPVSDERWGEWLLDIRTANGRRRIAQIVGGWLDRCAHHGFAAVELDNLDSFQRSRGLITRRHAKRFAATLVARAHAAGLAVAQKNWAEWDGRTAGFDFAIAEECSRWSECGSYADHYGSRVLVVEYRRRDFASACREWGERLPVVLRDLDLSPTGVRAHC